MQLQIKDDFNDILENPNNYPDEVISAGIESIRVLANQVYTAKKRLEKNLMERMDADGSSKMAFIDSQGRSREFTLSKGSMEADKALEEAYMKGGFNPHEIGDYVFKASWKKAREAMKYGGSKKKIIEAYFKRKPGYLTLDKVDEY